MSESHCRIDGMIAREANVAVIFRRGPSDFTQMLVWDLKTDEVTPGQWLKGRVYTRRCDVSPDGRYAVIAASNYSASHKAKRSKDEEDSWMHSGWTAICRPPYYTALACWLTGGAWNGGGIWHGKRSVGLNNFDHMWEEQCPVASHITATHLDYGMSEDFPLYGDILEKRGWKLSQDSDHHSMGPHALSFLPGLSALLNNQIFDDPAEVRKVISTSAPWFGPEAYTVYEQGFPQGTLRWEFAPFVEFWSALDTHGKLIREWASPHGQTHWVDVDARGRLVFGDKGCLWAWGNFPKGEPRLIADLNNNKFKAIPPPEWAKQW